MAKTEDEPKGMSMAEMDIELTVGNTLAMWMVYTHRSNQQLVGSELEEKEDNTLQGVAVPVVPALEGRPDSTHQFRKNRKVDRSSLTITQKISKIHPIIESGK